MKYEYKILAFPLIQLELNHLGKDGWEFIESYGEGFDRKFILKRQLQDTNPKEL